MKLNFLKSYKRIPIIIAYRNQGSLDNVKLDFLKAIKEYL